MTVENATREIFDRNESLLAIITRSKMYTAGVHFVTPNELQQQVAVMKRPAAEVIPAHTHIPVPRTVRGTQEVLVILTGALQADLYDFEQNLVCTEVLGAGDIITLVGGGHGFTVLEEAEFIEIKQGPYLPGKDKIVFSRDPGQVDSC